MTRASQSCRAGHLLSRDALLGSIILCDWRTRLKFRIAIRQVPYKTLGFVRYATIKGGEMKNIGMIVLAVWLIATGLRGVVNLSFQNDALVFGILAIIAGVLLIMRR